MKPFIHHNENSSGLYSGGFSKLFGLELTTFPGFFKQNNTTLNYTLYYMTFGNIMFIHEITQKEGKVSLKMRHALKFSERRVVTVSSHNSKSH